MDDIRPAIPANPSRFLDQLRHTIRSAGLAYETEKTYVHWSLRYIRFHERRHPAQLGAPHVEQFLSDLAEQQRCSVATQRLALNALVFLYQRHLKTPLGGLDFHPASRKRRMPTVFTHEEAQGVLANLSGIHRLIAALLYGSGLRISEALRLRVKDLDFGARQIIVRDGKGANERATLLPNSLQADLEAQIGRVETGYDIKLVQSLLGHRDIRTTEIYLHVVRNRAGAIESPVDRPP
jgi:integrase